MIHTISNEQLISATTGSIIGGLILAWCFYMIMKD